MNKDELLEAAYLAGFNASGEGYNGEFPFDDRDQKPQHDPAWCKDRDNAIAAIKQARSAPVQEPDWKDRLIAQHEETIIWQAKRIAELTDEAIEAKLKEKNSITEQKGGAA